MYSSLLEWKKLFFSLELENIVFLSVLVEDMCVLKLGNHPLTRKDFHFLLQHYLLWWRSIMDIEHLA